MSTHLSKSKFLSGLQCHKRLYLEIHSPKLATPTDEATQGRLDMGTEVGQLASDKKLSLDYAHKVINHAETYVKGNIHTNTIENFWSLLKRGIKGTYVSVEPFHLFRYLDEQTFRYNARKANDQDRFLAAVSTVGCRRIQYQQLIGQTS